MIEANVNVRRGWGSDLAREKNLEVAKALAAASRVGAEEARQVALRRRRQGSHEHMSDIVPARVVGTPDGWEGGFRSPAFYSGMQSRGTVASRRGGLKASTERRRRSRSGSERFAKVSGSSGITPLLHEEKGLAAARKRLVQLLNRL